MSDETPEAEAIDWGADAATWDAEGDGPAPVRVTTGEAPGRENHVLTLSFTPGRAPMLVVRADDVESLRALMDECETQGLWAHIGNHQRMVTAQGAIGAGVGPTTPVAPEGAPSWGSAPAAPAAAPTAGGWGQQAPAQGGWGAPAAAPAGGGRNEPKPRPTDWPGVHMVSVPPSRRDEWKEFRNEWAAQLKGKIRWAGRGDYWVHPDTLQGMGAWSPRPA